MSGRRLVTAFVIYVLAVTIGAMGVRRWARLSAEPPGRVIASVWRNGELVARAELGPAARSDPALDAAAAQPGAELVWETVAGEGPLLTRPDALLALSLVPGHDGVVASLDGHTAYVTPDDLVAHRAYDVGVRILGQELPLGVDVESVVALLADRLGVPAARVREEAKLRRVRVARSTPRRAAPPWAHVDGPSLTSEVVANAARDAARYLARGMRPDGHLPFLVDALSGRALDAYDWPRHAGATYFLAQAADRFHDPDVAIASLRAAALLRDTALSRCGDASCVGQEPRPDLGSAALTLLAFVEIARTGLDPSYADLAPGLSRFLRAQQREDGEFMHEYDRATGRPVDVQYLYYSGEAALALARAERITKDPADRAAAARAIAWLVGPAWRFFGDRDYFGEEHWTCQAMADLWDRAPDPRALDFCSRWQAFGRDLQHRAEERSGPLEVAYDDDGSIGVGPFFAPRLTPVASRCEAGLATLEVARREGRPDTADLERQQARAIALLVRRQLRPGPVALLKDPAEVYGAMPASEVELALRVDYVQHAGSAMIRWLDLDSGVPH